MLDSQLFFGIPLTPSQQRELGLLSPSLRELFIQDHNSECLQQIEYEGQIYLGKYLGAKFDLASLSYMEKHILSMINKWVPSFAEEKITCVALALSAQSKE